MLNQRRPMVDPSRFSMVPRPDIPRSTFSTSHTHKSTFDAGYLVPIHLDEVLPGDVHQAQVTIFARLSTPLFPIMDSLFLETFFFFVPARLLWTNWTKMMGERENPGDSISYTVPTIASPAGGFAGATLYDYFGLPTAGQITGVSTITVNALPFRAYNLIYNEWFRDENLQSSLTVPKTDGPDNTSDYVLRRRNKKHDYFTSALPWPAKTADVALPGFTTGSTAYVKGIGTLDTKFPTAPSVNWWRESDNTDSSAWPAYFTQAQAADMIAIQGRTVGSTRPNIYTDLSSAAGATVNALRLAVQTQRLLERDARSGTRYTELLRAHFGVLPEDARLQRPEYIGGGHTTIQTSAIPQTSATGLTGGSSPLGALGAAATATDQHSFSYHATEHGYIIGLANVNAELTYQQGLHRMWTRSTRYDFYWPVFAHLGEQAIRNDEIYCVGHSGGSQDSATFGYQERWAEYKHRPSRISGLFRSTVAGNIDTWHLSQEFSALPTLNTTFIQDTPPLSRVLAAGALADGMQILFDSVFNIRTTRAMPMFSVPGMMDRF